MSPNELEQLALMRRIAERRTTQRVVAEQLGLTIRLVERLYAAYKAQGAQGLVSRKRGAPSNRQLPRELRELAMGLVRGQYADFGPTLAHEKLVELHGLSVSLTTVRKWMIGDGAWTTRRERAKRVYQPRQRRACFGELVQVDGCLHWWFEGRGPQCTACDGAVVIEYKGTALPARPFVKDRRVSQGAIADNKLLGAMLTDIQRRQRERDAQTTKRLTLREEDLLRKSLDEAPLPGRRAPGRRSIRERALERADGAANELRPSGLANQLIAHTLTRLEQWQEPQVNGPVLAD